MLTYKIILNPKYISPFRLTINLHRINLSLELCLAKMRWFLVRLTVLFQESVIDLYKPVTVGFIFRNVITSLCVILPPDDTICKKCIVVMTYLKELFKNK